MSYSKGDSLEAFNAKLAAAHMRGQWTSDEARDAGQGGTWRGEAWEPHLRGEPYVWKWAQTEVFLRESCDAIPESFTARRSLIFQAPGLPRSTTHTMNVGVQLIKPGELAWTHRHTISALRFVIEGHPDLFTVVDGEPCPMRDNDLVLTPNWHWHDHHNNGDGRALWLDVLDGPLVSALNQTVFENYGDSQQPVRNEPTPTVMRFAWGEMEKRLAAIPDSEVSPHDGRTVDYLDAQTGGPVLRTIGAAIQALPAGFKGAPHRHSSSTVHLVIRGAGRTEVEGKELEWRARDCFVIPAWASHAHMNDSSSEEALLFSVTDAPALEALGLHRQDSAHNGH